MAAVNWGLTVQTKDVNNLPQTVTEDLVTNSGLLADMQTWFTAYAPLLDAVVGTQILSAYAVVPLVLPGGLKSSPTAGINQMIGALVRRYTTSPAGYDSNTYPGAVPAVFQASPNAALVDLSAGSVFTLYNTYLTTLNTTTQGIGDNGGVLAAIQSAIKNDRSNRPGLKRRHRR